ncbi:MAG: DnaJ domain-containing protein [Bacteroidetes bacterium]|nr:DnaJ domain-containing protein [Bacteroidota bacterium]
MNYFELYELPVSFVPDADAVKKKYYELSRKYHPDRFTMASDAERADALRMAAVNNDAYKVLNNADAVMAYILKLNGLLEDEEKYSLPPDFLMEMMELNEVVSEMELDPDDETAKKECLAMMESEVNGWNEEVRPLIEKFNAGDTSKELLLEIKDYYFRRKYLLRIQQRINTFATH